MLHRSSGTMMFEIVPLGFFKKLTRSRRIVLHITI